MPILWAASSAMLLSLRVKVVLTQSSVEFSITLLTCEETLGYQAESQLQNMDSLKCSYSHGTHS